jgi:hypothetical protein
MKFYGGKQNFTDFNENLQESKIANGITVFFFFYLGQPSFHGKVRPIE